MLIKCTTPTNLTIRQRLQWQPSQLSRHRKKCQLQQSLQKTAVEEEIEEIEVETEVAKQGEEINPLNQSQQLRSRAPGILMDPHLECARSITLTGNPRGGA